MRHPHGVACGDLAGTDHIAQAIIGEVGKDRGRTVTDQHRKVVRIARGAGLEHDVRIQAQTFVYQTVVQRTGRQQCMHRYPVFAEFAVGQHDDGLARAHRRDGFVTHRNDRFTQVAVDQVVEINNLVTIVRIAIR